MLSKSNTSTFLITILSIGVLVAVGSSVLIFWPHSRQAVLSATDEQRPEIEQMGRPALDVGDITPGPSIVVPKVELTEPGFIVVTQDENRVSSDVLGVSAVLSAGIHQDTQVGVHTSLIDSQVIHVVIYKDNGDGVFGDEDQPVTDQNGLTIEVVKNVGMLPMDHSF